MAEKIILAHIIDGSSVKDEPNVISKELARFKDNKYYAEFRKKNIELTKSKIKESVKEDIFIVQCINSIDELNKSSNMHIKRLREWASYPFPETGERCQDNDVYIDAILNFTGPRPEEKMSIELGKKHMDEIKAYALMIKSFSEQRTREETYLTELMNSICPNVACVAGAQLGARLIALTGNLERFAMSPASKIQLLGAETALFRHLKTGARPPKHGIIHGHPLVSQSARENKGKMARRLADKISLAAKVDFFKGEFIGEKLRRELEQ
jgi:nucleolar protein 56